MYTIITIPVKFVIEHEKPFKNAEAAFKRVKRSGLLELDEALSGGEDNSSPWVQLIQVDCLQVEADVVTNQEDFGPTPNLTFERVS